MEITTQHSIAYLQKELYKAEYKVSVIRLAIEAAEKSIKYEKNGQAITEAFNEPSFSEKCRVVPMDSNLPPLPVTYKEVLVDLPPLTEIEKEEEFECHKCHQWTGPAHNEGCDESSDPKCAWHISVPIVEKQLSKEYVEEVKNKWETIDKLEVDLKLSPEEMTSEDFWKNIKPIRMKLNLSQAEVAKALDMHFSYISVLERKNNIVHGIELTKKLAAFYNIKLTSITIPPAKNARGTYNKREPKAPAEDV